MNKLTKGTVLFAASSLIVLGAPLTVACATPAYAQDTVETSALFRLYNPNNGEHFFTSSAEERNSLISAGWNYETIGWLSPTSGQAVYRVYNPNTGDHHYTTDESEKETLASLGWVDEGIGWYAGGDTPVWRQYNPNTQTGAHNFTADTVERDSLISAGWSNEGVAWTVEGLPTAEQSQQVASEVAVITARRELNRQLSDGHALLDSSEGQVADDNTRWTLTYALDDGTVLTDSTDAAAMQSAADSIYNASVAVYASIADKKLAAARDTLNQQLSDGQALLASSEGQVADDNTRWTLTYALNDGNAVINSTDATAIQNAANAIYSASVAVNTSIAERKATLWQIPTGGAYPDLSQYSNINILISTPAQRVYIRSGETVIYTMITSTGKASTPTVKGTFHINGRGPQFISRGMGGKWWVRIYGNYLFHTVPINGSAQYIPSEAAKLGQPASHGCVRLSVPDAKWIYDNIPDGTTVTVV